MASPLLFENSGVLPRYQMFLLYTGWSISPLTNVHINRGPPQQMSASPLIYMCLLV